MRTKYASIKLGTYQLRQSRSVFSPTVSLGNYTSTFQVKLNPFYI